MPEQSKGAERTRVEVQRLLDDKFGTGVTQVKSTYDEIIVDAPASLRHDVANELVAYTMSQRWPFPDSLRDIRLADLPQVVVPTFAETDRCRHDVSRFRQRLRAADADAAYRSLCAVAHIHASTNEEARRLDSMLTAFREFDRLWLRGDLNVAEGEAQFSKMCGQWMLQMRAEAVKLCARCKTVLHKVQLHESSLSAHRLYLFSCECGRGATSTTLKGALDAWNEQADNMQIAAASADALEKQRQRRKG